MARARGEHRRLLAILVGDIVAYSRLMARKEADTYYRVKDLQSSVIVPSVGRNRGRVVKWTGDGFIATFASVVDAVRTAVEIQSGSAAAGATSPEDLRIRFRIGVNVGDVIVAPDDVYGDAVNVAVRLQTAAPPDGICVSRGVRDAVSGKVGIEFENRGELEVKNIPEPVGAYGVVFDPVAWTMERPTPKPPNLTTGKWPVAAAAALILLLFGGLVWFILGLYDATAPLRQQQALRTQLGNLAPGAPEPSIEGVARGYELGSGHKALAASRTPPGFWLVGGRASEGAAIEAVLDSCQVAYGSPCYLVAVNATLQPMPASPRDMPRPHYAGSFDPEQIPASNAATKGNRDVMQYATASAPKAIAYTPSGGRVFVTIGGDNQRAVEERALVACTADPVRTNSNSPCFLYAVGDMVVLPMRRREPLTKSSP